MRFSYFLALSLAISIAGVQWYQTTKYICPVPISYRLGEIDGSFSITDAEAKAAIATAADLWESRAQQDLFVYDAAADFEINFVFDDRQATANAQTTDQQRLDTIAEQNNSVRSQIAALQTAYEQRQAAFSTEKTAYETQLQKYNERVQQVNDRGGAAPAQYAELEEEQRALASLSDDLRVEAASLNKLASQLNEVSAEGNRLIETYNGEVRDYNAQYGQQHEFTQGDYRGGEINIYKFSAESELVAVLAHEFGHALGIEHVEEPGSLMYYLLDDELDLSPSLSDSDLQAYTEVCSTDDITSRVRRVIRRVVAKF